MAYGKADFARRQILACLARAGEPRGAQQLARELEGAGLELRPRTVRLYLRRMDQEGLTRLVSRRRGRELTAAGRRLASATGTRGGPECVLARMQAMLAGLPAEGENLLPVHLVLVRRADLTRALAQVRPFFSRSLGLGCRLALLRGEGVGAGAGLAIPAGYAGFCLPASLELAAAAATLGITLQPWVGCLLQLRGRDPAFMLDYARYDGAGSMPEALYLRARLTAVRELARGAGRCLASMLLLPAGAQERVRKAARSWERDGRVRILRIAPPGGAILGLHPPPGFGVLLALSFLNIAAVMSEAGVEIELVPLAGRLPRARLQTIDEVRRDVWRGPAADYSPST